MTSTDCRGDGVARKRLVSHNGAQLFDCSHFVIRAEMDVPESHYLKRDQAANQIYIGGVLFLRRRAPERVKMEVEGLKELDTPRLARWLEKRLQARPQTGTGT